MADWTKEEVKYLKENYYTIPLDDLAKELGRSKGSIINKQSVTNTIKQRKKKVDIDKCPNCSEVMNRVEGGYFCKYCLKEYDLYGEFLSPLGGDARMWSK